MRVVIITPAAPAHHLDFCARLAEQHDVVGVVHPVPPRRNIRTRFARLRTQIRTHGPVYGALRTGAELRNPFMGWDWIHALEAAEARFFPNAANDYVRSGAADVAHAVADVNDAATISLVRGLSPEVVVCLGGPIYREALIESSRLMVNFHSGISPLYNGASTIFFAFANGHVQLCGGTLMTMSPVVDGGDILAHYLPAIELEDDPAIIFMKTIRGAAPTCNRFLEYLDGGRGFARVQQSQPLFYCTGETWTVHQTHRIRQHLKAGTVANHLRAERLVEYWSCANDAEASEKLRTTVARLLGLS
jgi:formyl transferase-like protein